MYRLIISIAINLLLCAACTFLPESVPLPESISQPVAAAPVVLETPTLPTLPSTVLMVTLPSLTPESPAFAKPAVATVKPAPVEKPEVLIPAAQRQAYVEPSRQGYFGGTNEQRFLWQAGKLYVVYVSPDQMTTITLPPGELLASKVPLDPEAWDVIHVKVGTEATAHSVLQIRPTATENKDVDVRLLSETGHAFDLHLKVGRVGMFAVAFEMAPFLQVLPEEAGARRQP